MHNPGVREGSDPHRRARAIDTRTAFFRSPAITDSIKGFVAYLLTYEDERRAFPSHSVAMRELGLSDKAVAQKFRKLRDIGILTIEHHAAGAAPVYAPLNLAAILGPTHLPAPAAQRSTPAPQNATIAQRRARDYRKRYPSYDDYLRERTTADDPNGFPRFDQWLSGGRPPKISSGVTPEDKRGTGTTQTPEDIFPPKLASFDDQVVVRRRRFYLKETTTTSEIPTKTSLEETVVPQKNTPEDKFGSTDDLSPRRDRLALLEVLSNLCGYVPPAELHVDTTASRLRDFIDHFAFLGRTGIRDPQTWTRLALQRGWPVPKAARDARSTASTTSVVTAARSGADVRLADAPDDTRNALIFHAFTNLDEATRESIARSVLFLGKPIDSTHRLYPSLLGAELARRGLLPRDSHAEARLLTDNR